MRNESKLKDILNTLSEDDRVFVQDYIRSLEKEIDNLEITLDLMDAPHKARKQRWDDE